MRPLRDYQKVRRLVGRVLRNRRFQVRRPRLAALSFLHLGCGPQITVGFVNLDYRWVPGVDVVWDLTRSLPFPDRRFRGIFTEHCLEHLDENALRLALAEAHRILQSGGIIRIVVPSLEIHAQRYLANRSDENEEPARAINQAFYCGHDNMVKSLWINDGHHFMHDFASLAGHLRAAGFSHIRRAAFGQGANPALVIDRADRAWESLYVEAVRS